MATNSGFRVEPFDYKPALDGVRGLAVAAVFVFHTAKSLAPAGGLGVDVFFVLSGFLITTLLLQERLRTGHVSLSSFYLRRSLRLFPALLAMLVAMRLWSFTLPSSAAEVLNQEIVASLMYVYNFGEQLGLLKSNTTGFIYHTWSLAVEEQFYVVWPALFGLMFKYARATVGIPILAASLLYVPIALTWPDLPASGLVRLFSFHGEIILGCLAALVYNRWIIDRAQRYSQVLGAISMVSLVGILVLFLVKLPNAGAAHLAVSLLSAALTIGLVGNESSLTSRVLSWRPFVDVGVVSYGIYLWHLPVRAWCKEYVLPHWRFGEPAYFGLLVLVTAVVVLLSYRLIEQRALRLKARVAAAASTPAEVPAN